MSAYGFCPVFRCQEELNHRQVMCKPHWDSLEQDLKVEIVDRWNKKGKAKGFDAALRRACEWIERAEEAKGSA